MVHAKALRCFQCGARYPVKQTVFRCRCGGSLDVVYDYQSIREQLYEGVFLRTPISHWKYWPFYPITDLTRKISLGEGGTALLKARTMPIMLKNETTNPTASFKDRGTTVEITKALEFGAKHLACASTGNMGASVAAYSAIAGIPATIFLPTKTAPSKVKQIAAYGAQIVRVRGDYTEAMHAAEAAFRRQGFYLMGDYPYRVEGVKSVGYEIADQLNWQPPDWIFCPVGNGSLFYGIWKAFNDLKAVGFIDRLPRMAAVQAAGCSPVVDAWAAKRKVIRPVKPRTICSAVACGDPIDGLEALYAIKQSGGMGVKCTDKEVLAAQKALATREGIFAETSGALSVAGYQKAASEVDGTVVCLITGHGLKEL